MTIYLTENTSKDDIREAYESDQVFAAKLYPAGATTNSDSGVKNLKKIMPVLETMTEIGMPLLIHGEVTDKEVDDVKKLRESLFDSVCNFLVSYVLLRTRQSQDPNHPNDGPISMMVHTTSRTGAQGNRPNEINHMEVVTLLTDYLENQKLHFF